MNLRGRQGRKRRTYTWHIYRGADEWRWHCIAPNGRITHHGEGHATSADAARAIEAIIDATRNAPLQIVIDE